MTADSPAAKPPGKISRFFSRLVSWPSRLSLAARASLVLALALVALVAGVWIYLLVSPGTVPLQHALTVGNVLLVLCLLVIIPFVTYFALRLWLEGERSLYPDIDFAWQAGLEALERNGLAIDSIPLFLVVGSSSERLERALMNAAQLNFRVRGVPEGPAPLHWYANPERIYLVCSEVGGLSALSALAERGMRTAATAAAANPEGPTAVAAAQSQPMQPAAAAPSPPPMASPAYRGTLQLDQFMPAGGPPPSAGQPAAASQAPEAIRGTLVIPASFSETAAAPLSAAPALAQELPAILPPQEAAQQLQRLQYVCRLIRQARQPLCGINGVLALVPFDLVQAGHRETEELRRAVKQDLMSIQRSLRLRSPVTALVVGMEKERGFRELIRRVGRDRATVQRFGRRFDVRSVSSNEELAALSAHVCGAFEDWIYTLFREDGALTRPGNTLLYGLLCKVRCSLKGRLTDILADGFGHDPQLEAHDDPLLFSGCYFAATGDTEDKQGFVKGVLDKLEAEQEDVEWTQQAVRDDRRDLRLAYTMLTVDAALVLTLAWQMGRRLL